MVPTQKPWKKHASGVNSTQRERGSPQENKRHEWEQDLLGTDKELTKATEISRLAEEEMSGESYPWIPIRRNKNMGGGGKQCKFHAEWRRVHRAEKKERNLVRGGNNVSREKKMKISWKSQKRRPLQRLTKGGTARKGILGNGQRPWAAEIPRTCKRWKGPICVNGIKGPTPRKGEKKKSSLTRKKSEGKPTREK